MPCRRLENRILVPCRKSQSPIGKFLSPPLGNALEHLFAEKPEDSLHALSCSIWVVLELPVMEASSFTANNFYTSYMAQIHGKADIFAYVYLTVVATR